MVDITVGCFQSAVDRSAKTRGGYDIIYTLANDVQPVGASAALSAQGFVPHTELYQGLWTNINQGLTGPARDILATYWQQTINSLEQESHDFKIHQLPLARIKKVMKADPEVKMISAEAPILFAKGCDIFITELTMRAWIHAEDNKRRTLQRSDIAAALAKSDMFDFLIDIVPREESTGAHKAGRSGAASSSTAQPAQPAAPQQQQQQQMPPPETYGGMQQQDYPQQPQQMYGGHMGGQPQDPSQYGQPQMGTYEGMYGGGGMPYGHLGGGQQVGNLDPQ